MEKIRILVEIIIGEKNTIHDVTMTLSKIDMVKNEKTIIVIHNY